MNFYTPPGPPPAPLDSFNSLYALNSSQRPPALPFTIHQLPITIYFVLATGH